MQRESGFEDSADIQFVARASESRMRIECVLYMKAVQTFSLRRALLFIFLICHLTKRRTMSCLGQATQLMLWSWPAGSLNLAE